MSTANLGNKRHKRRRRERLDVELDTRAITNEHRSHFALYCVVQWFIVFLDGRDRGCEGEGTGDGCRRREEEITFTRQSQYASDLVTVQCGL